MKKVIINIIFTVLLVGLLSACGTPEAEQISDAPSTETVSKTEAPATTAPEPTTPAPEPSVTETPAAPTDTPVPTEQPIDTPVPTDTPVPSVQPTVAPTIAPTVEPTVAPTTAPTVEPTATPTPIPSPDVSETPEPTPSTSVGTKPDPTPGPTQSADPEPTPSATPSTSVDPEPTQSAPVNTPTPDVRESNAVNEAGSFISDAALALHPEIAPRPTLNKNWTLDEARAAINTFVFDVYGNTFFANGVGENYTDAGVARMLKTDDGVWGIQITAWRKGYDSNSPVNRTLNTVLEGMRFLIGDEKVASALWKLVDHGSIHGASSMTDAYIESLGFTLGTETSNSLDLLMDGRTIHWEWSRGVDYFYFD